MTRLQQNTITRYSTQQLMRHLDRFIAANDISEYRVDTWTGTVWKFDSQAGAYLFYCNTAFKCDVVELLAHVYSISN